jgi:hypothetical protein
LAGAEKLLSTCHSERSEESASWKLPEKQQIPRLVWLLGMTPGDFFRELPEDWTPGSRELIPGCGHSIVLGGV